MSLPNVIEILHHLHQETIEKDNYISKYSALVDTVKQMIIDPDLIQSTAYSTLKTKYIDLINTKLTDIAKLSAIQINPQAVDPVRIRTTKPTAVVVSELNGAIETNIYQAPSARRKIVKVKASGAGSASASASGSTGELTYIEFNYGNMSYYIRTLPDTSAEKLKYIIVNDSLEFCGYLSDNHIELIQENGVSQIIELPVATATSTQTESNELKGYAITV
jgi:hypothetical protein